MFDHVGNRKYLNAMERRAFLQAVKCDPDDLRRAFALTLFHCGCRISEALNVTTQRIDFADKAVVFQTLKQRKIGRFRTVPIPDSLLELLSGITQQTVPLDRIWPFSRSTAYRLIKNHMAHAGIIGGMASPKGLRHGFAVECLTHKILLPTVQKWLGHARLETTAIYLEVSGQEERALAARLWAET